MLEPNKGPFPRPYTTNVCRIWLLASECMGYHADLVSDIVLGGFVRPDYTG